MCEVLSTILGTYMQTKEMKMMMIMMMEPEEVGPLELISFQGTKGRKKQNIEMR